MTRYFSVAGHTFGVDAQESILVLMGNYAPFQTEAAAVEKAPSLLFSLAVCEGKAPDYVEELRQQYGGEEIICGHTELVEPVFESRRNGTTAGTLVCKPGYSEGTLYITGQMPKAALDNALMLLFTMASAGKGTALMHAVAISHQGKGYLFLGKTGTGKSTHARLWLQHVDGTELINDDYPVVRVFPEGAAVVYGSPWGEKTPCYKNVNAPICGIVTLSQAPYNKITKLKNIAAYAAVMTSVAGTRWDRAIADGLHTTESALATTLPVWQLECLPDKSAALMCKEAVAL